MVDLKAFIERQLRESIATKQALLETEPVMTAIAAASERCLEAYRGGNKVLLAGNGGSAADAQHIAAEFVSRFYFDRPALPSMALTTDTSILTAIGNDYGYQKLFRRQLEANGQPGDVFIAISTSGNSPNILEALDACREIGITSVGLTGAGGGSMAARCDLCIKIPSDSTPRIQETHIVVGHTICAYIEEALFGESRQTAQTGTVA